MKRKPAGKRTMKSIDLSVLGCKNAAAQLCLRKLNIFFKDARPARWGPPDGWEPPIEPDGWEPSKIKRLSRTQKSRSCSSMPAAGCGAQGCKTLRSSRTRVDSTRKRAESPKKKSAWRWWTQLGKCVH